MTNSKLRLAVLVAALASGQLASAQTTKSAQKVVFESVEMIFGGKEEADGTSWFKGWAADARFLFDPEDKGRSDELWDLLRSANEARRSVRVRYDASAGRMNESTGTIDYPFCTIALDDSRFESGRTCSEPAKNLKPAALTTASALALGFAEVHSGSAQVARHLLDHALASPGQTLGFRRIAFGARAEANGAIANSEVPWSEAADRARIAALADYRRLAEVAPNDVEAEFAIGRTLEELGDYVAAEEIYDQVLKRWSDEDFQVTVRRSAIARLQGDAQRSLNLLHGIVERHGQQDGMKYHYHRGWTLTRLGRFDEAIAAFNNGLRNQPDYAWAIIRRGCAHAGLGQLSSALEDTEFGVRKFAESVTTDDAGIRHDLARMADNAAALRAAVAAGSTAAMPAVCGGFWDRSDQARSRSALLEQ